jgi:hypothetical protein
MAYVDFHRLRIAADAAELSFPKICVVISPYEMRYMSLIRVFSSPRSTAREHCLIFVQHAYGFQVIYYWSRPSF